MNQIQFLCPLAIWRVLHSHVWHMASGRSETGVSITRNLSAGVLAVAVPPLWLVRKAQVRWEQVDGTEHPVTCRAGLFIE